MKKKSMLNFLVFTLLITACDKDPFEGNNSGTFTDSRDKNDYSWVRIGEQIWMAENLAWLTAVSSPTSLSETAPLYYVYGYNGIIVAEAKSNANYKAYGALYNWQAAKTACPAGWHLPSDAEWTTLTDYLGGTVVAGKKLKSTSGWNGSGNGDNSSGFNALAAGANDHKYGFVTLGYLTAFSAATEISATMTWYRGLISTDDKVNRNSVFKSDGYSVRCVKD